MRKKLNKDMPKQAEDDFSNQWLDSIEEEGQLSVDVFEHENNIVIKSTIAGAKPEDIEISVHNDMLTIKGKREMSEEVDYKDYLYRECYWGKFSRTIILPTQVHEDKIKADIKDGVLTITLPKVRQSDHLIKVKQK
ncbi:MAG: Hsp20/alpha crystallin family protein [bacterium]